MESKERCPPGAHWPGTRDLSKSCPVGTFVDMFHLFLQGRWRRFDGNRGVAPGGSTATCTSASIVFPFCRLGGGRTRNCRLTPAEQSMALSLRSIKHLIGCVKNTRFRCNFLSPLWGFGTGLILARVNDTALWKALAWQECKISSVEVSDPSHKAHVSQSDDV